jgi:hypothetical protein
MTAYVQGRIDALQPPNNETVALVTFISIIGEYWVLLTNGNSARVASINAYIRNDSLNPDVALGKVREAIENKVYYIPSFAQITQADMDAWVGEWVIAQANEEAPEHAADVEYRVDFINATGDYFVTLDT